MTKDKDFKNLARARTTRTGESYTTARRNLAAKSAEAQPDGRVYWFSRSSKGYSGKPPKPTGFEHHVVVLRSRSLDLTNSTAPFRNYGLHRLDISAQRANPWSSFIYREGELVVHGRREGSAWCGAALEGEAIRRGAPLPPAEAMALGEPFSLELPEGLDVVPSVLARFLPLTLPRDKGDLAEYVPVPEDGFPAWRPTTVKSWFPLMGASRESLVTPRVIRCHGLGGLKVGRKSIEAYRYDHADRNGKVHATTWIGEDDDVVQYEQTGLVLKAVTEEEARKLDPGKEE